MRIDCKILSLSACLFALLCLSSVGDASPPSDDVHLCLPLNLEDMQERDSLYAATKHALDLNVGEPRTVRMIYFLPNDRPFRQEVVDSMKVTIRQIQTFYAEQMQAHGYGNKTFRFETDAQDEPMVHRVDGQHPDSHYHDNTTNTVFGETQQVFDPSLNIYLIVIDNGTMFISEGGWKIGGTGGYWGRNGGLVVIPDRFHWKTAAHELGHAFGLRHDFRDSAYIMSFGAGQRPSISACAAEYLVVHTYFNPDIPIEEAQSPTIELLSPLGYLAGSKSVPVKLKVSDSDGLHQVIRFVITSESGIVGKGLEVKACRGLDGEQDIVIEFEYDGVIPSGYGTSLANSVVHGIAVMAIDIVGDVSEEYFELWEISPHHIATLEEHAREISSVVFSPDGKILASGSYDNTVKLWDVATGASLSTLEGHEYVVYSVAFSPDGKTLASGSSDRTIKLWDVATGANIATLKGYGLEVSSVAFSPDGTTLASGSYDNTIKLWDVTMQTNISTFEGHTGGISTVAYSPDGRTLASGSYDNTIKLWDVATGANIATFEEHTGWVESVAFSLDGTMLASGAWDNTIKLWDVATGANIATLEGHMAWIESVAFSPDGKTLASGSWDRASRAIKLWDVATGHNIATLKGHVSYVTSVVYSPVYSPHGMILAYGSSDGKVTLWDMSEYVTPVVYMPDANLRTAIRDALGKSRFAPITVTDMASLTTLDASNRNIRDLEGLEFATNLTELNLVDNWLSSLSINTHIPVLEDRGVEVLFDKTPTPDFDGDGIVGIGDFLLFVDQFGFSEDDAGYDARFDLDGDGIIGIGDFLIFANAFGKKVS